jgi:STE24 endopeptidase
MSTLAVYYTQVLFIALIVVNHLFELYLARRQVNTLEASFPAVPEEFKRFLSLEDHQKAIRYGKLRLQVGMAKLIWDAALLFYWFPLRGAERLFLSFPDLGIHRDVLFLLSFGLISLLLNLPWSILGTFWVEAKFGFNRSTPGTFALDRLKGMGLGAAIGTPLLYAILWLYQGAGELWWLLSFAIVIGFQLALVWVYPTWIAPLFNKFRPLEGEELKAGVERLVERAGFHAREVYVMDASRRSSHGNAYFTGFGKNKRIVFFDTLLGQLAPKEVFAILAHELGHLKLRHILKGLIASVVLSFIGFWLMGELARQSWFFQGHFFRAMTPGILLLLFTQALPLYTFWFSWVGSWLSRRREFEADAYAADETAAADLVSGLLKLYKENASPVVTDRLYSGFYHSHPPALERIRRLESLEGKPR